MSIAVATGQGWPDIQKYVGPLEAAAVAVDGEVVVADSSGEPAPPDGVLAPTTRWLTFPRASVYSSRIALLEACRGDVICVTEDHCLVDPGWALALRDLHAEYPEAMAIGGPVDNSADDHPVDWASYFVVQPDLLPPIRPGVRTRLGHANISYKRAALDGLGEIPGMGQLDSLHQGMLSSTPGAIRIDPAPIVWHDQARSVHYFMRQHYHAGRTFGGFVRANGGRRVWVRLLGAPAVPVMRLVRASVAARRSTHADKLEAALPFMLLLLFCQVSGQLMGLLRGAGNSPMFVEGG